MLTRRKTSDSEGRVDVTAWAFGPARAGGSCGNCGRRMIQMLAPAYQLLARDQIAPAYQLSALDHSPAEVIGDQTFYFSLSVSRRRSL